MKIEQQAKEREDTKNESTVTCTNVLMCIKEKRWNVLTYW
ncbi:hypothetical protein THOM_0748 [Trachipleistophora hominis]|uniref:Uncharacterized protein n=1 Tax=Trachipleistophora hominis TaxID=72359 RepID=L7JXW1_TRAHO|nr:hypothetical protein THOM_0748 [Trachipleistophora hominis]